jgi:hypothetical protein
MKLIVNLVNGNIHFLEKDAEFQFIEPVKKITLFYSTEGRIDSTIFIKMAANNSLLYEVKARGSKYSLLDLVQKKLPILTTMVSLRVERSSEFLMNLFI